MGRSKWELSTWGATELRDDEGVVRLRPRERALLASLATRPAESSSSAQIAELLWGDDVPPTARQAIQNHVARIRAAAGDVVDTTVGGYRLSPSVIVDPHPENAQGEPFADLADTVEVGGLRRAVHARRDDIWLADMSQRLDTGDGRNSLADIEQWIALRPDNERGIRLHARALAMSGRRRDALAAIRDANHRAVAVGHAPDRMLHDLERRLLDDDPTLRRDADDDAEIGRPGSGHVVGIDDYINRIERVGEAASLSLVAVTGPAGIGKTTLVHELRDRAALRGEAFFVAACSPEPSVPLEPFTEVLHQLADRFPKALAALPDIDVLLSLAPTLPLPGDHEPPATRPDRSVLLAAIGGALRCAPQPMVVVFEDLHWATRLTSQMLHACLAASEGGSPLKIVVTSRDVTSDLLAVASDHVSVEPWTLDTVNDYVARFGRSSRWCQGAADWIHRQSGGTALFIRELAVAALDAPDSAEFEPPQTIPANLTSALHHALQRLSPSTRRDLAGGAVLGRRFRFSEWSLMALDARTSRTEAVERGVLEDDGPDGLLFRHDLLHRLVLDGISDGRRIELHDLAFDAVRSSVDSSGATPQGSRLDELCHHAVGASSLDAARATSLLLDAIADDTARFAYEAGIERCRAGLVLVASGGVDRATVEFETRLGELLLRLGDPAALDELLTAARHALELGDDDLVAEAIREACRLGPTSVMGAVHDEAGRLLDEAFAVVTGERAAAILATAGVMLYAISGEYDRCRAFFDSAASYHGDVSTRVQALGLAVLVLTKHDDMDRRRAIEHELSAAAGELGSDEARWSAAHLRMTNQVQTGDPAMRDTLDELETLTGALRQRTRQWEFTNWSASVALTNGDPTRAEELATEALACADAVAESLVLSAYGAQLVSIRHAQGRLGELVGLVGPIVDAGDAIGAWHAVFALAAADSGDLEVARRELEIVVANDFEVLDRDYTYNGALFALAHAACKLGDAETARLIEPELRNWSGRWAFVGTCTMGPMDIATALIADLLGDRPRAVELAHDALASAQNADSPIYIAQAESLVARLQ